MPPKRKRADTIVTDANVQPSSRSTRSSTRSSTTAKAGGVEANDTKASSSKKGAKSTGKTNGTKEAVKIDGPEVPEKEVKEEAPPQAKRTRVRATTDSTAKKSRSKQQATSKSREAKTVNDDDERKQNVNNSTQDAIPPVPPTKAATVPFSQIEPYSPKRALDLFTTYVDNDDTDIIGPEGFENLCNDANISLEGALPLILSWQLGAKEMAKITAEEWKKCTGSLRISALPTLALAVTDLENLLIHNQTPVNQSKTKNSQEPYNRTAYWGYSQNKKAAFQSLYTFCFNLAKPEQSKNIDMETSAALWSVLLAPQYPVMREVLEFINEKGTYRASNKDLWTMMLEFCETVKPDLSDYEAEGAWPTLLDDFVAWKKSKSATGEEGNAIPSDN